KRERLAGEIEPACVKGPGQQGAVAHEEQPAGAVGRVAGYGGHILEHCDLGKQAPLYRPIIERAEGDPTRLLPPTLNDVKEMTTIRQKSREDMTMLLT